MPASTVPARRARFFFGVPLLLLVLLAAGCRSSQSAYQFRPAPAAQQPMTAEARPVITPPGASPRIIATAEPVAERQPAIQQRTKPKPRQLRQQLRQAVAQVGAAQVPRLRAGKSAGQAARRAAGPRHTAEVGLGTTVLGVLGLVVLPLSLIGLLIWGGPVWAVLAGLAALAVLIAYLDPFA
ncbi:hypothetical protein [Hymenobacter sp. 102]|uniref:hypothetical protein n=1 Tax=Hymenobacter sp. 102 TaxID=3403152 RepID=UPI003CFB6602